MEIVCVCTVFGVFILLAYTLGLKNGQKIINQQPIELPNINPIEIIQKKAIEKKQQTEMDKINNLLDNIDNYDGTGANQKEV